MRPGRECRFSKTSLKISTFFSNSLDQHNFSALIMNVNFATMNWKSFSRIRSQCIVPLTLMELHLLFGSLDGFTDGGDFIGRGWPTEG